MVSDIPIAADNSKHPGGGAPCKTVRFFAPHTAKGSTGSGSDSDDNNKVVGAGYVSSRPVHKHRIQRCNLCIMMRTEGLSFSSIRHGIAADQGPRRYMEDAAIAHSSLSATLADLRTAEFPDIIPHVTALYAVFDGHSGSHAAEFASQRLMQGVAGSGHFPRDIGASLTQAFMQLDRDYWMAISKSDTAGSGTTALAAVVWGSTLYLANAGDSRAVLSRSGKAIELTRDHKPQEPREKQRIELCGGYVCPDGRLCGELGVARAIGDYHFPNLKGVLDGEAGPLTAEPEITEYQLEPTDEFMVLGCDGLWDVLSSQRAIEFARIKLREHNNPQQCANELVAEAVRMHSSDNITVIVVCFGDDPPKKRTFGSGRFSRSLSAQGLGRLSSSLAGDVAAGIC